MATTTGDIHVGDVGTRYLGKILGGLLYDLSQAINTKLIWKTPDGVVERAATVLVRLPLRPPPPSLP
jgi:hypothetical protein